MRFFNTAGPVRCDMHYCVPPLTRPVVSEVEPFDLDEVLMLIDQGKYFVLHAPRQVGKTTYLLALMEYLNQEGKYRCLYFNVESAQAAREDVEEGMRAILQGIDEGLAQTWAYMDRCGTDVGHLVIFDREADKPWDEKIFTREEGYRGRTIKVWGM